MIVFKDGGVGIELVVGENGGELIDKDIVVGVVCFLNQFFKKW